MYADEIKQLLLKNLVLEKVYVFVDGKNCKIIAIDHIFSNKSTLEQHKLIYAPLMKYITNNKIHAISIHVFCPDEWNNQHRLNKV